jgi:hypothetical protein
MTQRTPYRRRLQKQRLGLRGIATLEFVLSLPVLLLLMVAITWLGFSVIGQTDVLITSRNKAWKRRFENASDKPLVFSATPAYSEDADYVTEKSSQRVQVSPIFDAMPGPEASHTILAGSWDHRAMPLDEPPNWKLDMVAVANAKTAGLQTALGDLTNLGSLIEGIATDAIAQVAKDALGGSGGGGGMDGLGSGLDGQKPDPSAGESDQAGERDKKKAELSRERDDLNKKIDEAEKELEKLQKEQASPIPIPDKPPQGQNPPPNGNNPPKDDPNKTPADKRRAQQIELLQTKIKRLKSDLKDVEAELDAAG